MKKIVYKEENSACYFCLLPRNITVYLQSFFQIHWGESVPPQLLINYVARVQPLCIAYLREFMEKLWPAYLNPRLWLVDFEGLLKPKSVTGSTWRPT